MKIVVLLFVLYSGLCFSQKLKVYSFEEVENAQKYRPKSVIINIYTEWCSVCAVEKFRITKNQDLVKLLNENFYLIKLEAEKTKETILFQHKKYSYIPNGNSGIHELALRFSKNKLQPIYPIWIILDSENNLIYYQEGAFKQGKMETTFKSILHK